MSEQQRLYIRHAMLVDKRYMEGLTAEEGRELGEVSRRLEEIEGPYYASAKELLRAAGRAAPEGKEHQG